MTEVAIHHHLGCGASRNAPGLIRCMGVPARNLLRRKGTSCDGRGRRVGGGG